MRHPQPLPWPLEAAPFTLSEADHLRVNRRRLRHPRLLRLSKGIRSASVSGLSATQLAGAYTRITAGSAASHQTAGTIWKLPHYSCEADLTVFHISRRAGTAIPRRKNVVGHTGIIYDDEITKVGALYVTTRERTWLDLAGRLSMEELVVIADHLIRIPRPEFEGRAEPHCTRADLQRMIDRHPGKRGIRKARAALELSRVGADSPQETRLRLALVSAGLPEPAVNQTIVDDYGQEHHQPDLSYPEYRVGIEYDGGVHSEEDQVGRDIERAERSRALGWSEVRISKRHMADEARAAVAKVRSALIAGGWS
jgi:hypothetical protein